MNSELLSQFDKKRSKAVGISILVTIIWSSTFVIVKIGLETLGPLTIAGLRYLLGALVLLPLMLVRKAQSKLISKELWIQLMLLGISSYTIGNGALFWGLKYIPATTGSFLMSFIPLLVLAGSIVLLNELPTMWQIVGVLLSLIGSGLFFYPGLSTGEPRGLIIVSVGLIGFMSFSLLGRNIARMRKLDTLTLTTIPLAVGGSITLLLAILIEGIPQFSRSGLLVVVWLALVNTAFGYLLYNHALRDMTALEMNMIMNISPLFTAVLSWLVLGEEIFGIQVIGMIIVIVGVVFVQRHSQGQQLIP
jgi:drug/metabolite transporter (DMT)-like permease